MCNTFTGERRSRRHMPRHPQCVEREDAQSAGLRGSVGVSTGSRQAERQRRWNRSLQNAGINDAIQRIHGNLLYEAERMSASMSYERFANIGSDTTVAQRILGNVLQSTLDSIRDAALEHALPPIFVRLLGAPLTYMTGFQGVYDQSRWDQRDQGGRTAYRTQQVYAHLLWVYASSAARGNLNSATEYNAMLVQQGLRYLRWKTNELPAFQRWQRLNFTSTELGPTIGLPSSG